MKEKERILILKICKKLRKKLCIYYKSNNLTGQCYYANQKLQEELSKYKINTELICGIFNYHYNHTWIEYKNNIIDLTACQFNKHSKYNFPKILIKVKSKLKHSFVCPKKRT